MNRLARLIGRVHIVPPFAAWLMALIAFTGGTMTARGQSNPYLPAAYEIHSMIDVTGVFTGYLPERAYSNILNGIQLSFATSTGSLPPNEDITRIAITQEFPSDNGDGDGGDLDAFDGVAWSFLSDTAISVKPFSQSRGNFNFQEGSQPSTGCGVGFICVPANTPTTVSIDWNQVAGSFPTSDRTNIFRIGFQVFGPSPPQDGTTLESSVSITTLNPASLSGSNVFQWEYIDPSNPSLGKRESSTLAPDGLAMHFESGLGFGFKNLTKAYLANADVSNAGLNHNNLTNAYLAHANLSNSYLETTDFTDADLSYANLSNTRTPPSYVPKNIFVRSNLSGANLANAALIGDFTGANFTGANLTGANVSDAVFDSSNLSLAQLYSTGNYQGGILENINLAHLDLSGANFSHKSLHSNNFTDADLSNANLSNISTGLSNFRSSFVRSNLSGANLANSSLGGYFTSANFAGANLTGADLTDGNFDGSNLSLAQLYSTASYQSGLLLRFGLAHVDLAGANFSNKNLIGINFTDANLSGANFSGAGVGGSNFADTNFTLAQLYSTHSYQSGNLTIDQGTGIGLRGLNLSGADFSNKNLGSTDFSHADLSHARLNNSTLYYSSFAGANLAGADLTGVQGTNVFFNDSNITYAQLASTAIFQLGGDYLFRIGLSNTNMSGGNFAGKYLREADLRGANFSGADLTNTILAWADIEGTNFANATVRGTDFGNTHISFAQLASTASYQAHDLTGIGLSANDLSGWNFVDQNLTNAKLYGATLSAANLTGSVVRGAQLSGITAAQLYSTASYPAHDLTGIGLDGNNLSAANFASQNLTDGTFRSATLTNANFSQANITHADFLAANLTGANFSNANLTDANFGGVTFTGIILTGANIRGANLSRIVGTTGGCGPKHNGAPCQTTPYTLGTGITPAQISATASYAARELADVQLQNNNFNGANFVGFNLTNSAFEGTTLVNANLSAADIRGSSGLDLTAANTANLIRPDGHVSGFNLNGGYFLRDYDGNPNNNTGPIPITIDNSFAMGPSAMLRYFFEADAWDSTISFAAGIPVARGGKLDLRFADGTNASGQIGRTFRLFDWTGVSPTGTFNVSSHYVWNLSNLYTTGEVTLTAVPEPAPFAFAATAVLGLALITRKRKP